MTVRIGITPRVVMSTGSMKVVLDTIFDRLKIEVQNMARYCRIGFGVNRITVDCADGYLTYNATGGQKGRKK